MTCQLLLLTHSLQTLSVRINNAGWAQAVILPVTQLTGTDVELSHQQMHFY